MRSQSEKLEKLEKIEKLDQIGLTASTLCAIHCAVMPLVVTALPLIGLGALASEPAEWLLFGLSGGVGFGSLCLGYRVHQNRRAQAVLAIGLALLTLGRMGHVQGWGAPAVALLVLGGLTVAASHAVNQALCRRCTRCTHRGDK